MNSHGSSRPLATRAAPSRCTGLPPRPATPLAGCGVGRVLVAARRAGFGCAIGVESAESLVSAARANMTGYSGWEVVHSDSVNYPVPDEATVFVFGQPIGGVRLAKVLLHIQRSVARRPRAHLILGYFNVERMGATAIRADVPMRRVIDGYYEPAGTSWAGWVIDA